MSLHRCAALWSTAVALSMIGCAGNVTPGPPEERGGGGGDLRQCAPADVARRTAAVWLATDNDVLDEQMLRAVARRARVVVIRAHPASSLAGHGYVEVVDRLHALCPGLPVLLYAWASHAHLRVAPNDTTEAYVMRDFDAALTAHPKYVITDLRTGLPCQNEDDYFTNVANAGYRSWLTSRVAETVRDLHTDGVAYDLLRRTNPTAVRCGADAATYAAGVDAILTETSAALDTTVPDGANLVYYNGLWNAQAGELADQELLLPRADGANIEFFGAHNPFETSSFADDLLAYVDALARTTRTVIPHGRWTEGYLDYRDDYLAQRYVFGAYLLGAGPHTAFRFGSADLEEPNPPIRSSQGVSEWTETSLDLGAPIGSYRRSGALYTRAFEKGLVVVAPSDGTGGDYALDRTYYTPEGVARTGTIHVLQGRAQILLATAPPPPAALQETFEGADPAPAHWSSARIEARPTGGHYLHVDSLGGVQEDDHDLWLDRVRTLAPRTTLELEARTTDASAQLLVVAEIDDAAGTYVRAVVPVQATPATVPAMGAAVPLHSRVNRPDVPYLSGAPALPPDGAWHTIVLDGAMLSARGYTIRRLSHVRLVGTLDVDDVVLR